MIPQFNNVDLQAVNELLSTRRSIVITTHHKPDGDALGSSLALKHYLVKKGHDVTVVSPSEFPDFLNWMEGSKEVIDYIKSTKLANEAFAKADVVFCLDFNDPRRVERMTNLLNASQAVKILIDHHLDPIQFCNYTFSFPQCCATAEIVYRFIEAIGDASLLDKNIASCLYAGIVTDTGSFRFDSVSPDTHRVAAALLATGIQHNRIHDYIYDSYSESRLRFLGFCLKDRLVVLPQFSTAHIAVSRSDMDSYKHQPGDLEGIVNFALSIKGIKMAALFSERDGVVKISFRSKSDFSVKELAERSFEGGGHKNAAGGRSTLSLQDTVKKFEELLPSYADQLNSVNHDS
jgi:bifunctional oligoribonuclease and PAP phosphatase NrnA